MAGHNKWSKIKRKKGVNDAKRGKAFSRIVKEITVAIKEGGSSDPDFNPRLRVAVNNAKGVNMPKENIARAIKKASEEGGDNYVEYTFEGYAPGGVAVFVECLSDNQNRTVSNVRAIFNKNNGNLATSGSVGFMFDRKGIFEILMGDTDPDDLTLELIDAGAEDIDFDEAQATITTDYTDFGNMQKKLEEMSIDVQNARLDRLPQNTTELGVDDAKKALRLIDSLEDDDDVQNVFHNLELTDELVEVMD